MPGLLSRLRQATAALLPFVLIVCAMASSVSNAPSASAAPLSSVPSQTVPLAAGGSAGITVRAFPLQPNGAMPQGALALPQTPLASARLRTTLFYGVDWGYADTEPQQVALAIWYAQT